MLRAPPSPAFMLPLGDWKLPTLVSHLESNGSNRPRGHSVIIGICKDHPRAKEEQHIVKIMKVKSGSPFEERESYSRVVCVDDWIFVSNSAGRNYKTREMPADAVGQLRQAFRNIEGALNAVDSGLSDVVRSRVTIPNVSDAPAVMGAVGEIFRGVDPASTVLCSPLGGPEYKVEVEITAYRGAGASAQERIVIDLS